MGVSHRMIDERERKPRATYDAPKLTIISLRPEEAVLANCKAIHSGGPGNPNNCNHAGGCNVVGS